MCSQRYGQGKWSQHQHRSHDRTGTSHATSPQRKRRLRSVMEADVKMAAFEASGAARWHGFGIWTLKELMDFSRIHCFTLYDHFVRTDGAHLQTHPNKVGCISRGSGFNHQLCTDFEPLPAHASMPYGQAFFHHICGFSAYILMAEEENMAINPINYIVWWCLQK